MATPLPSTPSRLRASFLVAGLALGALTVLTPTAAAADCGSAMTPFRLFPEPGSTRTYTSFAPLSGAASFLDEAGHCGILDFNVQLDGVDLGRYGTASASFSEYRIDTYPFQLPLAPGHHTLRFELFEVGGAVGVGVTEFDVVATQADLDYVPDLDFSLAPNPMVGVSTPGVDPVTGQPIPSVSTTLYTPGFELTSSLFIDLLRAAGEDYALVLHTPFGDVDLSGQT